MSVTARPKPFLEPQYCKGCLRCIEACPRDCITPGTEINAATGLVPVELHLENCNGCTLCLQACPEPYGLRLETDPPAPYIMLTAATSLTAWTKAPLSLGRILAMSSAPSVLGVMG